MSEVKRVRVSEVKAGDKIGDFTGDHWYTVAEEAVDFNGGFMLKVTYPDGGSGERVFAENSEVPVIE